MITKKEAQKEYKKISEALRFGELSAVKAFMLVGVIREQTKKEVLK